MLALNLDRSMQSRTQSPSISSQFTTSFIELRSDDVSDAGYHQPESRLSRYREHVSLALRGLNLLGAEGKHAAHASGLYLKGFFTLMRVDGKPLSQDCAYWKALGCSLGAQYTEIRSRKHPESQQPPTSPQGRRIWDWIPSPTTRSGNQELGDDSHSNSEKPWPFPYPPRDLIESITRTCAAKIVDPVTQLEMRSRKRSGDATDGHIDKKARKVSVSDSLTHDQDDLRQKQTYHKTLMPLRRSLRIAAQKQVCYKT